LIKKRRKKKKGEDIKIKEYKKYNNDKINKHDKKKATSNVAREVYE